MAYRILGNQTFKSKNKELVSLREQDLTLIKDWRNSQRDVLRTQKILTDNDQINYFRNVIASDFSEDNPRQILVSYLEDGQCLGYGGLTNIDWSSQRAEVSFLMKTSITLDHTIYQKYFGEYLALLKKLAFKHIGLNRLFTETYDLRPWHIAVLERSGFRLEGRMREHVKINGEYVDSLLHGCLRTDEVQK
jgi:RimJ/RimL family protein N-acetyltransferase